MRLAYLNYGGRCSTKIIIASYLSNLYFTTVIGKAIKYYDQIMTACQ